jgi:hypothetical protein
MTKPVLEEHGFVGTAGFEPATLESVGLFSMITPRLLISVVLGEVRAT